MRHTVTILEGDCDLTDDIAPEYDFANMQPDLERTERFRAMARARLIQLDADLAALFPDSLAVNAALRELLARRQSESAGVYAQR